MSSDRFPQVAQGSAYSIQDPERYVDPASGQVLIRFVNEMRENSVGFQFQVAISGVIS